ncbi:cysteine--tRNA ligase [Dorea sp. AM13-35]|uniref:cysteine--tRNA ligase n=1 Tax=Dorea sp. AM13-35 TaxID=2293099 RepID=UPI000E4C7CDE|nr:cysteine--tRNA ligase [Dorea sp. AM13-35]RHO42978.1 cysteine--tRNA ligase [Dorea sp. AM13-35]
MKLYNTLSKQKEEFTPLEEGKVKMYVCGPTVYNFIHIGNARPMIVFDTVRRYFEYKGYDVNYVSNFTDVDDKIIKKANEEGVSSDEISKRYIAECKKDMDGMNIEPATKNPLATEEISGMIEMIQTLIDKGYAYEKNGTVYYSTRKFKDYGKLSHKNLDDLRSGERSLLVSGEDEKEDPLDFVLWKPKKEGEPFWKAPWSEGRPGWHIECSEMSKKYLGEQIDIHAGGEDLVFPHHENEIAQSEAANGKEFAKYWMHNAFLNIDNRKMSKSLGNFRTVREISEQYDLQVLRFFMLSAHYRSPLNFSADLMEASKNGLERIVNAADNLKFLKKNAADEKMTEEENKLFTQTDAFVADFERAMEDDFNTADAIAAVFDLVKFANSNTDSESSAEYLGKLFELLVKLTDVLGLLVDKKEDILDEDIEKLIEERQAARKAKDFARADAIRDELLEKGIVLKDTREGVQWKRA